MNSEQMNKEGLTWSEWAYAAAIEEPPTRGIGLGANTNIIHRTHHGMRGYARHFRNERKAWRNGEDPTEWRASA